MGRKSRQKREARLDNSLNEQSKKILKEMIKESQAAPYVIDGKIIYFNPLKKLLEGKAYKTEQGFAITNEMVKAYNDTLKKRYNAEQIAKQNNINPEDI